MVLTKWGLLEIKSCARLTFALACTQQDSHWFEKTASENTKSNGSGIEAGAHFARAQLGTFRPKLNAAKVDAERTTARWTPGTDWDTYQTHGNGLPPHRLTKKYYNIIFHIHLRHRKFGISSAMADAIRQTCKCKRGRCPECGSSCRRCGCACDGTFPAVALATKPGKRGRNKYAYANFDQERAADRTKEPPTPKVNKD